MKKDILLEINRMREMMGLSLIVEQSNPVVRAITKAFEQIFEKTEEKSIQNQLRKFADGSGNTLERKFEDIFQSSKNNAAKKMDAKIAIQSLARQLTESELVTMLSKIPRTQWESLGVLTTDELAEIYVTDFRNRGRFDQILQTIQRIQSQKGFNSYIENAAKRMGVSNELMIEIVGQMDRGIYEKFYERQFEVQEIKTVEDTVNELLSTKLTPDQKLQYITELGKMKTPEAFGKYVEQTAKTLGIDKDAAELMFIKLDGSVIDRGLSKYYGKVTPLSLNEKFVNGEITAEQYIDEVVEYLQTGPKGGILGPTETEKIKNYVSKDKNLTELKDKFSKLMKDPSSGEQAIKTFIEEVCKANPRKCMNTEQKVYSYSIGYWKTTCLPKIQGGSGVLGRLYAGGNPICWIMNTYMTAWSIKLALITVVGLQDKSIHFYGLPNFGPEIDYLFPDTCLSTEEIQQFKNDPTKTKDFDSKLGNGWTAIEDDTFEYINSTDAGCDNDQLLVKSRVNFVDKEPKVYEVKKEKDENGNIIFVLQEPREGLRDKVQKFRSKVKTKIENTKEKADSLVDVGKDRAERELEKVKPNNSGNSALDVP